MAIFADVTTDEDMAVASVFVNRVVVRTTSPTVRIAFGEDAFNVPANYSVAVRMTAEDAQILSLLIRDQLTKNDLWDAKTETDAKIEANVSLVKPTT